jgi:hypothetical protein
MPVIATASDESVLLLRVLLVQRIDESWPRSVDGMQEIAL